VHAEPDVTQDTMSTSSHWLEIIGKAIPVIAVAFPIAGATYRVIAFSLSGRVPAEIGVVMPVTQLGVLGAQLMFYSAVGAILLALMLIGMPLAIGYIRRFDAPRWASLEHVEGWRRVAVLIALLPASGALLVVSVSLVGGQIRSAQSVTGFVSQAAGTGLILWFSRAVRKQRRVPLRNVAAAVAVVALVVAIGSSLGPTTAGTRPMEVRFEPSVGLTDGMYTLLGEDEATAWLLPCTSNALPVRVASDAIVSMSVRPYRVEPVTFSVSDAIAAGKFGPGFSSRC
jgi:hypothetical protein